MKNEFIKEHVSPIKLYIGIACALFVLTAITVLLSFVDMGGFNAIVAVGIATFKALLVAFFFMHLWYDKKLNLFIFSAGLLFVGIFIALTMFDTLRRADIYEIKAGPINKEAPIYEQSKQDSTRTIDEAHH